MLLNIDTSMLTTIYFFILTNYYSTLLLLCSHKVEEISVINYISMLTCLNLSNMKLVII